MRPHAQVSPLEFKTAGNDFILSIRVDGFKVKGDLVLILTEPVGFDHIGQADDGCIFMRHSDDQLDAIVAGRFPGKHCQYSAAAQVNSRARHFPGLGVDLLGSGNITGLDGQVRGHSEIIAQRLRCNRFPGGKMEPTGPYYAVELRYQVHGLSVMLDNHVAVAADFQIIDLPGIRGKNQFQQGRVLFNEQSFATYRFFFGTRNVDNDWRALVESIYDVINSGH